MIQGANSFLFPQHLLPDQLRDVKVAILIGKCLREQPEAPPVEPKVTPTKRGRPRKGEQGAPSAPRGRFGGQGGRSAEEQIRLLQSDMNIRAIPEAPFRRQVQDIVASIVQEKRKWVVTQDFPDIRVSKAAMDILQDAVEAHAGLFRWDMGCLCRCCWAGSTLDACESLLGCCCWCCCCLLDAPWFVPWTLDVSWFVPGCFSGTEENAFVQL